MMDLIYKFANHKDRENDKAVIIFILSHGQNGCIAGCDQGDDLVDLNDIFAIFNDDACKALRRKPKLFIIDGCRKHNQGKKLTMYIMHNLIYKE